MKKLEKENLKLRQTTESIKKKTSRLSDQLRKAKKEGFCQRRGTSHTKTTARDI